MWSHQMPRVPEPSTPDQAEALINAVDNMPVCIEREGMPFAVMLTAAQFDALCERAATPVLPKA